MFLASVGGRSQCALPPPVCMVSSTLERAPYNTACTHISIQAPQHSPPSARMNDAETEMDTLCYGTMRAHIVQLSISGAIPPTLLTIPETHRRDLFSMAVKGR